jgi:hypothetical protein
MTYKNQESGFRTHVECQSGTIPKSPQCMVLPLCVTRSAYVLVLSIKVVEYLSFLSVKFSHVCVNRSVYVRTCAKHRGGRVSEMSSVSVLHLFTRHYATLYKAYRCHSLLLNCSNYALFYERIDRSDTDNNLPPYQQCTPDLSITLARINTHQK